MEVNCLFIKNGKCTILTETNCQKCKFFKEDTEENREIMAKAKKQAEQYCKKYLKW